MVNVSDNFDIKKYIRNAQADDKSLLSRLAKVAEFKNTTPISKWLDTPDRELDSFNALLAIVKEMFPEDEYAVMESYSRTLNPNKKTAKYMLEYAKLNKLDKLFNAMLYTLANSTNKDSVKWAKYYKLDQDTAMGTITLLESIKLANVNTSSLEMDVFTKLIQVYGYYELKNYSMMFEIAKVMESEIDQIEDEFIKSSYKSRVAIVLLSVYLHMGDIDKLRKCGYEVLENAQTENLLSLIHMQLGNSYIFESFDKSYEHFQKALKISIELKHERIESNLKRTMNFLFNYWGKEPEYINYSSEKITDKHDIIFSLIRQDNKDKATEELEKMNMDNATDSELAFNCFLRGLISMNKDDFYQSIQHFMDIDDKFYRKAPLIELQKLGESKVLLKTLAS